MQIKFCGGCNPLYNRKNIYNKLIQNLKIINSNKVIILNGCQRGCKTFTPTEINSQEYILENLNGIINEEKIYEWILKRILNN